MSTADPRIAFFDDLASTWDNEEPSGPVMVERLASHAELLSLEPGQSLLEVGCGTGKTTGWLAEQISPGRVTAVDFSSEMIAKAESKGIPADFRCLDVCSDDLGEGCFDVILCFHCFPHFRDQAGAMRSLTRALAPNGKLIVMHLAGSEQINRFHAGVDGPVQSDVLPSGKQWGPLLSGVGLMQMVLIDQEDMFYLEAVHNRSLT